MSKPRSLLKGGIQALNVGQAAQIPKHLKFEAPRVEVPQGGVTKVELVQKKVPQVKGPQSERGSLTGFFPLSFDIFYSPEMQRLSGDAFRVFLWMNAHAWRFPTSKGQVQASIGRVSRETGVSEAGASRIFSTLQDKALIQLLESDFKYGNIWQVKDLARAKVRDTGPVPQSEGSQNESPQIQALRHDRSPPSKRGSDTIKTREEHPHSEGEVISNNKDKKSLSPLPESAALAEYIATLKPQRKRESESASLKSLLFDYSAQDIELAFKHLSEFGLPGSGEPCHSPMSYLSQAMTQVLSEARTNVEKFKERESQCQAAQEAEAKRAASEQHELEREASLEKAFAAAFPTQESQEAWIDRVAMQYPVLRGCGSALRNLAISAWVSENQINAKETV